MYWSDVVGTFVEIIEHVSDGIVWCEYQDNETGKYAYIELAFSDLEYISDPYEGLS